MEFVISVKGAFPAVILSAVSFHVIFFADA